MTTTKLTKTQHEVLKEAASNPKGRVYVQAWSKGTNGGGNRKLEAMIKLADMGLLCDYAASHHQGIGINQSAWSNPLTCYTTEAAATITEEGRKAL